MSALAASGVGVVRGERRILDGVTLTLEPGEVTAIVGPNGAGKSTLLACLAGLLTPSTGDVTLGDGALTALAPRTRAQRIAFLPQSPEIAWPVEVETLVGLGRTPYLGARGPGRDDRTAVAAAMAAAGVSAFAQRLVTDLSGGERARALIARALAGAPEWLLADEPLTGLDPAHQLDAADLFRRLAQTGVGVVVTLHDLTMALRLADRVIVLAAGAVLTEGSAAAALTGDVLRRAYGVEAVITSGPSGPLVDILRRSDGPAPSA